MNRKDSSSTSDFHYIQRRYESHRFSTKGSAGWNENFQNGQSGIVSK